MLAKQLLSQLSYVPLIMVGLGRLERPTSPLSGVRSNHLSYRPRAGRLSHGRCMTQQALSEPAIRMRKRNEDGSSSVPPNEVLTGLRVSNDVSSSRSARGRTPKRNILRKEVIQPQVPLRLPCYDFTPVADPTVVACPRAVGAAPSGKTNSHGVTGGVYKARERIHRGVLIHDY